MKERTGVKSKHERRFNLGSVIFTSRAPFTQPRLTTFALPRVCVKREREREREREAKRRASFYLLLLLVVVVVVGRQFCAA